MFICILFIYYHHQTRAYVTDLEVLWKSFINHGIYRRIL